VLATKCGLCDHRFERQTANGWLRLGFGADQGLLWSPAFADDEFAFQAQELIERLLVDDQFLAGLRQCCRTQAQQLGDARVGVN
jgi:hypothetical protein